MKLQYLAVIFIIIIMPMIIVFSEYMNTQIDIIKTEQIYDARLFDTTHDAINAFKINTINSTYYAPQSRVKNIEASVNTFYNSLLTSFEHDGNLASTMKSYVPAVVFTMYDGYYIYSPFENKLTGVSDEVDDEYREGKIINGLKPFVSYSCRYEYNNKKYIITYSMDNYVFVDVFDKTKNEHKSKGGYLINGIEKIGEKYKYDKIAFTKDDTEILKEKIIGNDENDMYYYTIFDGTKYYYYNSLKDNGDKPSAPNDQDYIFYIDEQRERHKQVVSKVNNEKEFMEYYNRIFKNNYAYLYYKEAFEFTTWLLEDGKKVDIDGDGVLDEGQNLQNLSKEHIIDSANYSGYEFVDAGKIFDSTDSKIQYSNSNFNRHRADVIRAVITTNLSTAITGYKKYSNTTGVEFLMPKISEKDWELLENNICIASFMQGIKVKGSDKTYNSYCVIPNNFNKEFVDENDIYILTNDFKYTRANDNIIKNNDNDIIASKVSLGFEPGLLRIDLERRQDKDGKYYNPITLNGNLYLESYTSFAGASEINTIEEIDMYRYIEDCNDRLKRVYYTTLGRERYGSFKYTINEM